MSRRFGDKPESRWSTERERMEREQREKEFDAKAPRPSRRSSWRSGSASRETPADSSVPESTPEDVAPEPDTSRQPTIGRKWRDSVESPSDAESALPNLPGEEPPSSGGGPGKTILLFGAILFVLMGIFAFLPFGLFGGDDSPTPTATVPVALVPTAPGQDPNRNDNPTAVVERPAGSTYVVCIDPGHGGWDFGRQRKQDEFDQPWLNESEVNLGMAYMLRDELEARGVTVVMTRETGTAVNVFGEDVNNDGRTILDSEKDGDRDELQARINICNASDADVLISLHLNGYDDQSANGYEVLYTGAREFGDQNLDLATAIYRQIGAAYRAVGFETTARGTIDDKDLDTGSHEFGSEQHLVLLGPEVKNPDYTIVPSNMPGVIIEPVFITNQNDVNFIVVPDNQQLLAKAYADGIMDYLDKQP
ncbi:MAG TPA: N-acetylmuramoyl-L-alanine amidase [Thermomicrobiales bacterium]|nr:N-acetylmuramoyl-L-alanine amidase [Thermomicrobiales bacterium]